MRRQRFILILLAVFLFVPAHTYGKGWNTVFESGGKTREERIDIANGLLELAVKYQNHLETLTPRENDYIYKEIEKLHSGTLGQERSTKIMTSREYLLFTTHDDLGKLISSLKLIKKGAIANKEEKRMWGLVVYLLTAANLDMSHYNMFKGFRIINMKDPSLPKVANTIGSYIALNLIYHEFR